MSNMKIRAHFAPQHSCRLPGAGQRISEMQVMKRGLIVVLFLTLVLPAGAATLQYNGRAYVLNGVNVPWNWFGNDVGDGGYDANWFENLFTQCEQNGINCVRLWIHCSGWASPEFDANGYVTGLSATFLSDMSNLLLRADNHKVMVMPCLWSFDMTKNNNQNGIGLIATQAKTQSYIDNALVPMVRRFADTPNLVAWEISNEPEWSVVDQAAVTKADLQRFCAMIAAAIHENSGKMVTVGSACLKWNSDMHEAEDNWWKDSVLQAAYTNSKAYLDFYQIHYYDWMVGSGWAYDPFKPGRDVSYWGLDKPVIVGECPGAAGGLHTIAQQLQNGYSNNYAGVLFWSYNSDWSDQWATMKVELKGFRDAHPGLMDYSADSDSDGMPDWWECHYFGNLSAANGSRTSDQDGDGFCDLYEYLAGTNPTNAASVLKVSSIEEQEAGMVISWQSVTGKLYAVQRATNMVNGLTERLASNIVANPPLNTYTATLDRVTRFYRVSVQP
jgi:hypothetical protein